MPKKNQKPTRKPRVPGIPREHRMIDAREERDQVKKLPKKKVTR